MLISKDMVVKGYFSQPKIFKIIFSFLGQKIAFKNIYNILQDFSKFSGPLKALCRYFLTCYFSGQFTSITQEQFFFPSFSTPTQIMKIQGRDDHGIFFNNRIIFMSHNHRWVFVLYVTSKFLCQARDQKQIYRLKETKSHWGLNPPPPQPNETP